MSTNCVLDFDIDKIFIDLSKQEPLSPYIYYKPNYDKTNKMIQNNNSSDKYRNWLKSLFINKI